MDEKFLDFLRLEFDDAKEGYSQNSSIKGDLGSISERYTDFEIISVGGMKEIYRIHDNVTDRYLVYARLKGKPTFEEEEAFLREARITANLEHPNIIPLHDIGIDDKERPFFIMKLIDGQNLSELIKGLRKGSKGYKQYYDLHNLIEMFLKIGDAVSYAHSKGILHLDLKPANIQVGKFGDVIVCDWGLAKIVYEDCQEEFLYKDSLDKSNLELTLKGRGTPGYMPPEQFIADDPVDKRSDIYALGGVLYNILTWHKPLEEETIARVKRRTLEGRIVLPSLRSPKRIIPASLEAICLKAMEVKPDDRYQTVESMIEDVQAYLRGFAPKAEKASFITQALLLYKRNKKVITVILASVLIIVFSTIYFIQQLKLRERMAEIAKVKAIKAKEASEKAEKKAKENFINYKNEITKRRKVEVEAAVSGLTVAIQNINQENYSLALIELKQILKYDTKSSRAWYLKALIGLLIFDIELSKKSASKLPKDEFSKLILFCNKLTSKFTADDYMQIIEFTRNTPGIEDSLVKKSIRRSLLHATGQIEQNLIKKLILFENGKVKQTEKLKAKDIKFEKDGRKLICNSKVLRRVPPLAGSSVTDIDLSNSELRNMKFCLDMKLINLNVENTPINIFALQHLTELSHLNIAGTPISKIPYKLVQLETLNLRGCKIGNYERLPLLKNLKVIYLDENQVPLRILKRLKCKIIFTSPEK